MSRFLLVHHGEASPLDAGYEPGRLGQISRALISRGHEVTRVLPRHPHLKRSTRIPRTYRDPLEGAVLHLETEAYERPRGWARYRFLKSFRTELLRLSEIVDEPDVILAAFFPGVTSTIREAVTEAGWRSQIVVDIRDIWPDAQLATARGIEQVLVRMWAPRARQKAMRDLDSVDAALSVSEEYLEWAERICASMRSKPKAYFPIASRAGKQSEHQTTDVSGRAVFVGSVNTHFDFESMIRTWELVLRHWNDARPPSLTIVGEGPSMRWLHRRCAKLPSIRLTGYLPSSDAYLEMRRASVGLAPYHPQAKMTSTNKVAEYLANGLFVVTSLRNNLCKELERFNCIDYWDFGDLESSAVRLSRRLKQSRANFAESATRAYRTHFDADSVSERLAEFLEDRI